MKRDDYSKRMIQNNEFIESKLVKLKESQLENIVKNFQDTTFPSVVRVFHMLKYEHSERGQELDYGSPLFLREHSDEYIPTRKEMKIAQQLLIPSKTHSKTYNSQGSFLK